jgi:hypothetical protein
MLLRSTVRSLNQREAFARQNNLPNIHPRGVTITRTPIEYPLPRRVRTNRAPVVREITYNNIGIRSKECNFCDAKLYEDEDSSLCCASGKVKLNPITPPPAQLIIKTDWRNHVPSDLRDSYWNMFGQNGIHSQN